VSQKKTSHFNFRHNFAICWDIFTIFEAPCSGIIARWCNLLHTHHRCEAFTWRDVNTWRHSSCNAQCALTPDFIPSDLWCLNSLDLNPADYSFWSIMQEKVYHSEYRWVETSASSDVGRSGPQTYRCSYRTAATPSQWVWQWLVCESSGGIFWTTFALNLHVALWAICWIVGLCNI